MRLSLIAIGTACAALFLSWQPSLAVAEGPKVLSEKSVTGFPFPESVAYDAAQKVLYVGQFVSALKPTEKDGKGRISKVSIDGKVLEQNYLPAAGGEALNKPKGIWVAGDRLWVTDIDVVWVFDTKTKKGRKVALPDVKFANDPTVIGDVLYVSDNRGDALYRVDPANFLDGAEPKVTKAFTDASINPNGLYPGKNNSVLMAGFKSNTEARGIFVMTPGGKPKPMSRPIGRLDGLYLMADDSLLVTDWNSGTLFHWAGDGHVTTLASGFKGPADFTVIPGEKSMTVVVPDLVKSELRFVQISK
ncbi:MAG: hypothetical protein O2944_01370 [Proteobacteria bacterium]|nr:hypothetical protein [Pseudomonadota bacterium]